MPGFEFPPEMVEQVAKVLARSAWGVPLEDLDWYWERYLAADNPGYWEGLATDALAAAFPLVSGVIADRLDVAAADTAGESTVSRSFACASRIVRREFGSEGGKGA